MEKIYLSRRNLKTLLSKLDRQKDGDHTLCTLIKNDSDHPEYSQSMDRAMVTAVEDDEYYTDRKPGRVHPKDEKNV